MVRLITGAGGMMGSHLYEALKDKDVLPTFYKSTLDPRETITDEMEMMDVLEIAVLVQMDIYVNLMYALNVFQIALEMNVEVMDALEVVVLVLAETHVNQAHVLMNALNA